MGILEGGFVALAFFLLGRYLPSRRKKASEPLEQEPVCGCEHNVAYHDQETGQCHGTVRVATHFSIGGTEIAWEQRPCTCRHYTGPEVLPSVIDLGIAGGPQ